MSSTKLTSLQRRVLRYHGMPARDVAIAERLTVTEVTEVRAQLRARGITPSVPGGEQAGTQLTLGDVDHLMRTNRAPAPERGPG